MISSAALRKAYPAVCIQAFSAHIQPALPPIISNSTNKNKDRTFSTMTTVCLPSAFETGKYTCFQTAAQNTVLCQPIKFCLRFFLSEFEIVGEKAQSGRDERVMEDRKTAPALRARLLRSYVPLRCVRTKVRPPALPHPFPTEISPPTNSNLSDLIRFPVLPLRLRLSRILQCLHLQHSCL